MAKEPKKLDGLFLAGLRALSKMTKAALLGSALRTEENADATLSKLAENV